MAETTSNTIHDLGQEWEPIVDELIEAGHFPKEKKPVLLACYSKLRDYISDSEHIRKVESVFRAVIEPGTDEQELKVEPGKIRKAAFIWAVATVVAHSPILLPQKDETANKLRSLFDTPLPLDDRQTFRARLFKLQPKKPAPAGIMPSLESLTIEDTPKPNSHSSSDSQSTKPGSKTPDLKIFISGKYLPVCFRTHPEYVPFFEAEMKMGRLQLQLTPGTGNLCGLYAFAGAYTYHRLGRMCSDDCDYQNLRQEVVEACLLVMKDISFLQGLTFEERKAVQNMEMLDMDMLPEVYKRVAKTIHEQWDINVDAVLLHYNRLSKDPEVASVQAVCLNGDKSDPSRNRIVLWIVLTTTGVAGGHYEWVAPVST